MATSRCLVSVINSTRYYNSVIFNIHVQACSERYRLTFDVDTPSYDRHVTTDEFQHERPETGRKHNRFETVTSCYDRHKDRLYVLKLLECLEEERCMSVSGAIKFAHVTVTFRYKNIKRI